MATTNLPRVSPPTQHVSEKQLIIFVLTDLFAALDQLAESMAHRAARIDDLEAIISGQVIEGTVVRRDY